MTGMVHKKARLQLLSGMMTSVLIGLVENQGRETKNSAYNMRSFSYFEASVLKNSETHPHRKGHRMPVFLGVNRTRIKGKSG